LKPKSVRRAVAYVSLLIVAAFERVGKLRDFKACLWRRHPDVVYLGDVKRLRLVCLGELTM